jgi:hypothetical protein
MSTTEQQTRLTVEGTLGGITENPDGRFDIAVVRPGKEHPLRLATWKQELVDKARAAAGPELRVWEYTEKDSGKPNPHKPGENFINRYFESVGPAGSDGNQPVATAGSNAGVTSGGSTGKAGTPNYTRPTVSGNEMTKEEWARKDSAGHKRACIAIAVSALQHTMPSDPSPDDLKKFNERVLHLALGWHRSVLAERDDPTGESVPF